MAALFCACSAYFREAKNKKAEAKAPAFLFVFTHIKI
nr:MAG TPA: hypothetical protein [Caudoviricetes sp.]